MLLSSAKSGAVQVKSDAADAQAKADNVASTPTMLVGRTGGTLQQVALKLAHRLRHAHGGDPGGARGVASTPWRARSRAARFASR